MGFALRSRVKISFVDETQFSRGIGANPAIAQPVLGETRAFASEGLVIVDVRDVLMLQGLPALWFAKTLVHENMHAWIWENHIQIHDLMFSEGLCEVLAFEWLRRQRGELPAALGEQMLRSPDPIYGEGLRAVRSACSTGNLLGELDNLAARKLQALCMS
jgi:hypothetical protein